MKILAFVDLHASFKAFKGLKKKIKKEKPDVIVCSGDLSIFEQGLAYILRAFNKFKIPFLVIHGNHETQKSLRKMSLKLKDIIFMHKKSYVLDDCLFLGYGGSGFLKIDPDFKKIAGRFKKIIGENKDKKIILVTHAPPYGTKIDKIGGKHFGNKTIMQFLKRNRVDLLVCGHFHETAGKEDKIGKTKVINPGPCGKMINMSKTTHPRWVA